MDQNEVTKHFSVGNTIRQSNDARSDFLYLLRDTWIRPMVKSRRNMKKKTEKKQYNNEISDGVRPVF